MTISQTVSHAPPSAEPKDILQFLTPHLVRQVDEALIKVGPFGEVRLVVHRGRLRFIQIVRSENVSES